MPEKALARSPSRITSSSSSGGSINARAIAEPPVRPDFTYLFLAFVGVPVPRHRPLHGRPGALTPASRVFWALCLSSFAIYVLTPAGPHDTLWKLSWLAEDFFRALLPALLLHFFLIFPRPARPRRRAAAVPAGRSRTSRRSPLSSR